MLTQGAGRKVVAHLVQASELVANLTKWQTRRDFLKRSNEFFARQVGFFVILKFISMSIP